MVFYCFGIYILCHHTLQVHTNMVNINELHSFKFILFLLERVSYCPVFTVSQEIDSKILTFFWGYEIW